MNSLRIPTSNTTEQAKIQALINEVYRDIYVKEDWWWLVKRTVINTVAQFNTGTLEVTNSNTTINVDSTVSNPTAVGWVVTVQGNSQDPGAVYRVATVVTSSQFTIDAGFTGVTSTAQAFAAYQDSYNLPADCGKVLLVKRYGEWLPLRKVGLEELSRFKILDTTVGRPELWTVIDYATTGDPTTQRQLQVHPFPDKTYRLEIFYKQQLNTELSSTTQPFLPDEYRQILVYGALARGYPIFLNDLERGKFYQSLFNDMLALMVGTHREYAKDLPQIAMDEHYRMGRRRQRVATTLGSWFDRLPVSAP